MVVNGKHVKLHEKCKVVKKSFHYLMEEKVILTRSSLMKNRVKERVIRSISLRFHLFCIAISVNRGLKRYLMCIL